MEKNYGHCCICHKDNVELSDEHVIPEAIGGYYHIYNVCKDCNSRLGDHVDKHLLNHWIIKAARHEKGLRGYSGTIPNPLIGDGVLPSGEKVRVEEDAAGKLQVHLLPSSPKVSPDGKSIAISVDAADERLIPSMQSKAFIRNNIDTSNCQIKTHREIKQIEHPEVRMQFAVDLKNYKLGLLKIAYEFAVDKIPDYYNDPMAQLYADILHEGNVDRIDEAHIEGDAFVNANLNILDTMIDNSNTDRHILLLVNFDGKLYCIVKLFDKLCQAIRMSDKAYGEDGFVLIALNDFKQNRCDFLDARQIVQATMQDEYTSFELDEESNNILNTEKDTERIGFACNVHNENLLFNSDGKLVTTESELLLKLEESGKTKNELFTSTEMSVTYTIPEGYHYLLMPSRQLLRIKEITKRNVFKKI